MYLFRKLTFIANVNTTTSCTTVTTLSIARPHIASDIAQANRE